MSPENGIAIHVLLVEDHAPTRQLVKALISQEADLVVVADVGSGEEAVETARRLGPDVVVMDIKLPGMNGIDAARRILSERPDTRVLVLSNHTGQALIQSVLDAGGLGYVRKSHAFEELVPAIRAVSAGKQYLGDSAT